MNNYSPATIFFSQVTSFCIYIFQTMYQRCLQPIRPTNSKKQLQVPTNLVVDNNNKLQVTVHDILSLANYTYLNDVILNYILDNHHTETSRSDIYLLDSLFFSSLTHHPELASNWTKNINLFAYNKILVPICQCQHWTLIVISPRDNTIQLYNSLLPRHHPSGEHNKLLCRIQKFLHSEYHRIYKNTLPFPFQQSIRQGLPQQTSSADCGLFAIHFASCIMTNTETQWDNYPNTIELRQKYARFCMKNLPVHLQDHLWSCLELPRPIIWSFLMCCK